MRMSDADGTAVVHDAAPTPSPAEASGVPYCKRSLASCRTDRQRQHWQLQGLSPALSELREAASCTLRARRAAAPAGGGGRRRRA